MIDKKLQELVENQFKNRKGRNYPCSNQIVDNFIIIHKYDEYTQNFIKSLAGKYIQTFGNGVRRLSLPAGECFKVMPENVCWHAQGYRFYKIYVDCRINKRLLYEYVLPCCALYCCMLKFF